MSKNFFMNRYYVHDLLKFKVVAYTVAYVAYVVAYVACAVAHVACAVAYVAYDKAFLWLYLGILKKPITALHDSVYYT